MPPQTAQQPDTQSNGVALPQIPPTRVVRWNQCSFAGGEYSPQCDARTDMERYKIGLETCRNAYSQITGCVSNRPGFRMVAPVKNTAYPPRIVKFIYSTSQVFFIEVGNYYMRFYTQRAQIQATGVAAYNAGTYYLAGAFVTYLGSTYYCIQAGTAQTPSTSPMYWVAQTAYEIPTPYAQADINQLRFEESADFVYIAHQNYPPMILERLGNANWSLVSYLDQVIDGPFMDENTDTSLSLTTNAPSGVGVLLTASAAAWQQDFKYNIGDYVSEGGLEYECIVPNVSAGTVASSPLSPNTVANASGAGTVNWSTGSSPWIANGNGGGGQTETEYLKLTNFGFNIPAGAVILGIQVTVNEYTNVGFGNGPAQDASIKLVKGGVIGGTEHSAGALWPTSPANVSYGNSGDLWGETLAYSDINSANFGIAIAASLNGPLLPFNATINSVTITVYYSTGNFADDLAAGYWLLTTISIFNAGHIGALWRKTDYIQGQSVVLNTSGPAVSTSISCFTSWLITSNGTWTGAFQLEMSEDGGNTWTVLQYFTGDSNFNVQTSGTESVTAHLVPFLLRINCTSLSSGSIQVNLSTLAFYQDGFMRITGYNSPTQVVVNVLQTLGSTGPSITWAEGAWSPYRGYPGMVRFYEDRLVWGGAPGSQADNYWMTVAGDYISFLVSQPVGQDSDGISEQLSSRQLNAINGMVSFQALLMLTSSTSWAVQPISGSALTPSTVEQAIQDYNGSDGIDPVVIGNESIFSQFQGKVIRSIIYNFYTQSFTSSELNPFARHLLKDWSVISMCYQQNPDNIVWMLRSDGQLIGLTYLKEQEVVAWHHHDTNGVFNSIDAAPGIGYTEVWATVTRPNGGFIEVLENRIINDVRQSFFLDNGISNTVTVLPVTGATNANPCVMTIANHGLTTGAIVEFDSVGGMTQLNGNQYLCTVIDANHISLQDVYANTNIDSTKYGVYTSGGNCVQCFTTFSGLSYLNGQTVSILGDGFVFPKQVVAGGSITLPRACGYVSIGMQYLSDVETLPVELSFWINPAPPMTTQGRRVKIGEVTFGFTDSRGGWIGVNVNDVYGNPGLREAFIPKVTNPNKVIQLYTGDLHEPLGLGWCEGARVFYRQYDPLPFTITRIIPAVIVGGETALAGDSNIQSVSGVGSVTP